MLYFIKIIVNTSNSYLKQFLIFYVTIISINYYHYFMLYIKQLYVSSKVSFNFVITFYKQF